MKSISVLFTLLVLMNSVTIYSLAADKDSKDSGTTANYQLSGDAQLLSHFIVKGLSYSDNNPAMNASFLAHLGTQVKLGFWGSNISNVGAADDNFWFKVFGKIDIELSDKLFVNVFLHDNHFYKSNARNGQALGLNFNYKSYEFGLEWMSNLEGTKSNAEYFWLGKLIDYRKVYRYGGYSGLTYSHASAIQSYFDFKLVGQYLLNDNSYAEIAMTINSNSAQFGIRDDPALYAGIKLSY